MAAALPPRSAVRINLRYGFLQDLTVVKCYVDAGQPYVIDLNACCT
jgi:hypothetical protein